MIGLAIKPTIGIGDALQFSSLPENYFMHTGLKMIDLDKHWFFDHNPYIVRNEVPSSIVQLWNFSPKQFPWPDPRPKDKARVYTSNAEIWAAVFKVPVQLIRPRLYKHEDFPFEKRRLILLHVDGRSHGDMPEHIVKHVVEKYGPMRCLYTIGRKQLPGLTHINTENLWDLAEVISQSRMLIGMDSGPAWIGACYPDVIVKKIRTKPTVDVFREWIPLEIDNIHSHWDDRCHQIFNPSERDVGFTASYKRI